MSLAPFLLQPEFSRRPWGRHNLSPWYELAGTEAGLEPIGEAWLTGPKCVVADGPEAGQTLASIAQEYREFLLGEWREEGEFPLLLKLLFPDDKLSVQVHPDDEQARAIGQPRGKTECWYVVDAEAGATVACGLIPGAEPHHMPAAVRAGTMEDLMKFIPVVPGDMVFVDAGTVHAIGPGVTLLETQQTSDTTFRIYDYGRPRELHLDSGVRVSRSTTRAGKVQPQAMGHGTRLIQERYFTVDRFEIAAGQSLRLDDATGKPYCFTTLEGRGNLRSGCGPAKLEKSHSTVVPACVTTVDVQAETDLVVVRSMP